MSEGILQLHTYMYLLICTLTICTFVHRKLSRNEHYKFVELRRQVESQQGSSGGREILSGCQVMASKVLDCILILYR